MRRVIDILEICGERIRYCFAHNNTPCCERKVLAVFFFDGEIDFDQGIFLKKFSVSEFAILLTVVNVTLKKAISEKTRILIFVSKVAFHFHPCL